MDTPLTISELFRLLPFPLRQRRALKKAGFDSGALIALAYRPDGLAQTEAVLACHTNVLGRPPRPGEAEVAEAARDRVTALAAELAAQPRVLDMDLSASGRGRMEYNGTPAEIAEMLALLKAKEEADKKARRQKRAARRRGSDSKATPS